MDYKKQYKIVIFYDTTNVSNNRWSVHFVDCSIVGKNLATVEGKGQTIKENNNNLSIELTADLDKSVDIYEVSNAFNYKRISICAFSTFFALY